jgi:tRNA-2-methylthio-N6-dimethylallyladenosine synthase
MNQELSGLAFSIRTFGCQMNENDSEHIAGLLVHAGAVPARSVEESDIIIINTCAVRKKPEEKIDSYLGRLSSLKRQRPRVIGVVGCIAQLYGDDWMKKRPMVDLLAGPGHTHEIASLICRARKSKIVETSRSRRWNEIPSNLTLRSSPFTAYIPIMEGCNNFCAYCVVPFSRGREKFRPLASILEEIRAVAASGTREIQFLGQNVNAYRDPDSGTDFAGLLRTAAEAEGIAWIRFITSHPKDLSAEISKTMAAIPTVCRQLHLPLQSGSSSVLARMKRGYDRKGYLGTVAGVRSLMPEISLSTDIIVGFPGESERDFEETLEVLSLVRFSNIFSFRYSERPGTAAIRFKDDVPLETKKRRLIALQDLQKNIQLEAHKAAIGKSLKVLCIGESKKGSGRYSGRTEGLDVVNFNASRDVRGEFVDVLITGCGPYSLHGRIRETAG